MDSLHVRFRILNGMFGTIHRQTQEQMLTEHQWDTPWAANLQNWVKEIGWQVSGPWHFAHQAQVGFLKLLSSSDCTK